ncbi:hypothetical protein GGQ74_001101 [Desulfobaculum xiamenense]|uniref:HD domain-containing protein n=1 Tax=Desulfobaculum xiamenense TaxID=995050 RepID=A0A846QGV5_9BACT|nr:HDIG domain-containing metalloprotein [Desulfobaculum xiamenense]NJB67461.1 hypothetical protein [Desulfobaculum xiamenense]
MNAIISLRKKKASQRPAVGKVASSSGERSVLPRLAVAGSTLALLALLLVLLVLSGLAAVDATSGPRLYLVGEIADRDVVADREFLVENAEATRAKRRQASAAQPVVFDLTLDGYETLEKGVYRVFETLNSSPAAELEDVRWRIAEDLNAEIGTTAFQRWRHEDFQNLVLGRVLPWMKKYLERGVVAESAALSRYDSGIMVRDAAGGMETLRTDPAEIADLARLRRDLAAFLKTELKKSLVVRRDIWTLIGPLVGPSLALDPQETAVRKRSVMETIEPVYFHVREGEVIVRQGEAVSEEQHLKLKAMASSVAETYGFGRAIGIFVLASVLVMGLVMSTRSGLCTALRGRDLALVAMVVLLFGCLAKFLSLFEGPLAFSAGAWTRDLLPYALPLAGATGVLALFFPYALCFYVSLILAFMCTWMFGGGLPLFVFYFAGGMFQTFLIKQTHTRYELLRSVLPLLGGLFMAWSGVAIVELRGLPAMAMGAVYVLAGGVVSLLLVLALSPIVEFLIGYTSRFKLMELMNLEQPLLQELMVAAPGTYHHSLVVSNMVEAGARAIGANPLLAKVAALYHDIGKITKPQYFIENQLAREKNKHDKLTPSMSALILISHVKKGVELAHAHKLGVEIADIIQQHHGTTLISFFYHKAKEQAEARGEEDVREEEFRYPGPKPQTKEAGLILLADAIEASSRTLTDPTPSRIKGHIESVIKRIFSDGQLDESELTLKDLHRISEIFHRILTGIFHQRIEYPAGAQPRIDGQAPRADAAPAEAAPREREEERPRTERSERSGDCERVVDMSGHMTPGRDGDATTQLKFNKTRAGGA